MKPILFLLLTLCFVINAHAQPVTDWKRMDLEGKVKSFKAQETYRYKKGGVFTEWEKTWGRLNTFDKAGKVTGFQEFGKDGAMTYKIEYLYKPKEKRAEITYFDKDLTPTTKNTYLYDDKGNKTEEINYNKEGSLTRRYTFEYDGQGNNTIMINYKPDGTLYSKTTWTYDNKGNATCYKLETPGYATGTRKFIYDDRGNKTEETWYNSKGSLDFRFVRSYDEKGNLVKEIKYKGADTALLDTVTWRYEYDKVGNWTKRVQSNKDGADFHIEERVIVYY